MESSAPAHPRKNLVLTAMIFAVAMTFIDQTTVAIPSPELQGGLNGKVEGPSAEEEG